jgi:hypothetical protein
MMARLNLERIDPFTADFAAAPPERPDGRR